MATTHVNGVRLHHVERGAGAQTILFSHGLLWNHHLFDRQVEQLAGEYRCIAYDHRGQGKSEVPRDRSIEMETLTEDAAALIETLGAGPCHFVGLSMGGFVGLRLAIRRPELLRSLVLMDTTAEPEPEENLRLYRWLNRITRLGGLRLAARRVLPLMYGRTFLEDPDRAEEVAACRAHLLGNRRTIYRAVNGVLERAGVADQLDRIDRPTLVLVGEEDTATPPVLSQRLAAGIDGARLVTIPGAGHCAPVEAPERVTAALRAFLPAPARQPAER